MSVAPRWRKVTKAHPGKKWEGKVVIVAYMDKHKGRMRSGSAMVPKTYIWDHEVWQHYFTDNPITHWMPWPETPEMPKEEAGNR